MLEWAIANAVSAYQLQHNTSSNHLGTGRYICPFPNQNASHTRMHSSSSQADPTKAKGEEERGH
jgi:hypothetical protein